MVYPHELFDRRCFGLINGRGFDSEFSAFLRTLKQKSDIVEVIRSYVAVDRKGGNYWACCPFHHEKTPSFAVNEGEQFYHCFGCQESGDVIKFVQEIESTDFMGAVRILAERAKMTVPESNFDTEEALRKKKKRDAMSKILLDSARFYLGNLYSGDSRAEEHLEYISKRGLSPTTVKKFGLGASLDFYSLPDYLAGKGYCKEDLVDSGVLSVSEKNGKLFDSQGGRLIFPIINAFDEVIGFGGRVLKKTDFGKYKNTKETMLFDKSKTLYNVNLLKKLKREQPIKEVIIVEGYMDTISLYQAGFKNVVASMGTSLTKEQARLVKRYTDNVLISYDGDFAGQKADLRGLEILDDAGLQVRVVPMPEGLDPDDVARQGADAYQKCLDAAMPLIDYRLHALERKFDLSRTEEKRRFVTEALKVVKTEESASVREELLKKLRDRTGITYHALERDLQNLKNEQPTAETEMPKERLAETAAGTDKQQKAKRFILAAKLFSAPYAKELNVNELPLVDETHIIVAQYIAEHEKNGERIRPSELFELLDESSKEFNEILDLNYGDKLTGEVAERFFKDSVKTLQMEALEQEIASYNAEYAKTTDEEERKAIAKKLAECIIRRNRLKKK
ncbi:MAG: DNA primase [Clostridiales bacterium]|nr:DNA primase [Clostridiales bacterium]